MLLVHPSGTYQNSSPPLPPPRPADPGGPRVAWEAQAFLGPPMMRENKEGRRETQTSGPACGLPLISEFCAEKTPLETENIRLKKRQRGPGVGSGRKREGTGWRKRLGRRGPGRAGPGTCFLPSRPQQPAPARARSRADPASTLGVTSSPPGTSGDIREPGDADADASDHGRH